MNHRQLPDAGLVPHHILDQLHTLFLTGQLRLQVATPDVSNPPTDAELDAVTDGNPGTAIPGPSALPPKSAPASSVCSTTRPLAPPSISSPPTAQTGGTSLAQRLAEIFSLDLISSLTLLFDLAHGRHIDGELALAVHVQRGVHLFLIVGPNGASAGSDRLAGQIEVLA